MGVKMSKHIEKEKAFIWKTESAHEKVGLSSVAVQRGRPSRQPL